MESRSVGIGSVLAEMFEQAPTFMALLRGPEHRFELANPSYQRLVSGRPLIGLSVSEALPEAAAQGFVELLDRVYRTGEHYTGAGAHIMLEGGAGQPAEERILDFVYQPLRGSDGAVNGIFVQGVDVTEQTAAKRSQRESEELYRGLFDAIDEGFCIIEFFDGPHGPDSDYIHVQANAAYTRHAGIPNVVGKKLREMVGEEADAWVERYGAVLRSGESIRFQQELVATGRFLDLAAFRIEPPSRKQVAVLFHDVTAKRRAEIALADLNATLEEQVEQRTAELMAAEEALRHAQKMESIGQLTGGIAHDFNNLLMAITSSLELLERRVPDDPDIRRLIDNAQQGAKRGAALTQRMLAFARRQDLASELVHIPELIRGMLDLMRRTLGPAWPVECSLPASLPPVFADANQLEMAVLNLAVNARDAMPGGGAIRISAEEVGDAAQLSGPEGGAYLVLRVADTGSGMDSDTLARAIEPFFTTKGVGKGTGLGLSMVHGLAEQLGGRFRLESVPGRGTVAALWLPAVFAEGRPEQASEDESAPASVGSLKILAVDDDALILMNTAALLEDLGHEVLEACSGEEGLDLFAAHPDIDLVITDHAMPGMTGAQMAEQMIAGRPDLPLILASGYGDLPTGSRVSAVKLGKPFNQARLEQAIAEAIAPVT